jgi:hypothetical protein
VVFEFASGDEFTRFRSGVSASLRTVLDSLRLPNYLRHRARLAAIVAAAVGLGDAASQ